MFIIITHIRSITDTYMYKNGEYQNGVIIDKYNNNNNS